MNGFMLAYVLLLRIEMDYRNREKEGETWD